MHKVNWNFVKEKVAGWEGTNETLHDMDLTKEMLAFIALIPATSIVETGTSQGVTARFLASVFSILPLYTCDKFTNHPTILSSLSGFNNITYKQTDSREFVEELGMKELGPRPFYFLDAHARGHANPLSDELNSIIRKLKSGELVEAGVCIHDFAVENKPQFPFNKAKYDGTDLCWNTIKFVKECTKAAWFPLFEPLTKHSRGRIFLYMSVVQPILPYHMNYLENLGILDRFF